MKVSAKLQAALSECALHAEVLGEAMNDWEGARVSTDQTPNLTGFQRRLLDQLAYRFSKLQDSLGEKVLPGLLDLAEEPLPEETPFAVKLQRLERLGVVEVEVWRMLRELRNQIAHEYIDQPALKAAAIDRFLEGVARLIGIWRQAGAFVRHRIDNDPPQARPKTID
ncbi:MAG: hypothetical protein L0Y43_08000 [Methylococcaceae bacterium]|nr:hypothetical protein [Methylococcaceae bacterium]